MSNEYAQNPRAHFDFEILDTVEAGVVLKGSEVKSVKTGKASIKGSYVKNLSGGLFLVGATIAPYQPANTSLKYEPDANRKLLLTKKQMDTLAGLAKSQGIALVPLKFYAKRGLVKLLIGIAKGKKKYDKRESIKKKDVARAKQRGVFEE